MPASQHVPKRTMVVAAAVSAVLTAVIALVLPPTQASADSYAACLGPANAQGCRADDTHHTFCFSGRVPQPLIDAGTAAMSNLSSQADWTVELLDLCDNLTDVIFIEDVSLADRGAYSCIIRKTGNVCERAHIRLNPNRLTTANDRRKTACHEVGHSVGLKHGVTTAQPSATRDNGSYLDCMRSGDIVTGQDFQHYDQHHVDHIVAGS